MRLAPPFYAALHDTVRAEPDRAGLDALRLDDPLDVALVPDRISDTVLVTEDGPRRLTSYPRDLTDIVIGA